MVYADVWIHGTVQTTVLKTEFSRLRSEINSKQNCSTGRLHSHSTYIDMFGTYLFLVLKQENLTAVFILFPIQNTRGWNQGQLCLEPKSTWQADYVTK